MKRGFSLIPILLGAVAGGLVAVLQAPKPSRSAAVEAKVAPADSVSATVAPPARTAPSEPVAPVASTHAPTQALALPVASASAGSAEALPNSVATATKSVFDLSEPTSEASLLEAEVACNRAVPDACERAARALESGAAGTKDPGRGRALKRIALTLYVKQCEGSRPAACARLAEMYEVGEVVQKNEKSVQGLRARVAELCKTKPKELGCDAL